MCRSPSPEVDYECSQYEYDQNGHLMKETDYGANGVVLNWITYEYDQNGHLMKVTYFKADGSINAWTEYNYDNSGNLIRVNYYDSSGAIVYWDVYEYTTPPGTPCLSTPSNGKTNVTTTPTFNWGAVTGATSYDVEVCTDSDCSFVLRFAADLTATQWTVFTALNKSTTYFWRAKANNSCGSSPWSTTWRFATGNCFIATAASGTGMEGKVYVLRSFRDTSLTKTPVGNAFVSAYETYSPPIADCIAKRGWLRAVVRALLLPIIGFVSLL